MPFSLTRLPFDLALQQHRYLRALHRRNSHCVVFDGEVALLNFLDHLGLLLVR